MVKASMILQLKIHPVYGSECSGREGAAPGGDGAQAAIHREAPPTGPEALITEAEATRRTGMRHMEWHTWAEGATTITPVIGGAAGGTLHRCGARLASVLRMSPKQKVLCNYQPLPYLALD